MKKSINQIFKKIKNGKTTFQRKKKIVIFLKTIQTQKAVTIFHIKKKVMIFMMKRKNMSHILFQLELAMNLNQKKKIMIDMNFIDLI